MLRPAFLFVVLSAALASRASAAEAASGFQWVDRPEQGTTDLLYNGRPALRYMYAFDRSNPRRTVETFRVFHHVFGPGTGELITKGAGGYEPHHRGLFVGWRDTEVEGKTINTWAPSNGAYQRHVRFLEKKSDSKSGSMTSEITWNDANDKPFLDEIRSVRVANVGPSDGPPVWQIDWTTTLSSRRGEIKLRGDRQHAGFQFRAAQEVAEKKSATYIRPKGFPQEPKPYEVDDRKNPDRHVNLGWFAMSYEVKGTRYTVAYFEDPALPKPSMFSERPYGRFGAYFKATVTPDKPLTMRYRLIVTSGTAPARDAIQAQYDRFVADVAGSLSARGTSSAETPPDRAELVFPLRHEHNHASGLVECPNGDLIASWYRGHGERTSDDVAIYGARLRKGETRWSPDFLMWDTPGFPDCNTCMMIDPDNRLWLFWPVIIANSWESAQTNYLYSRDYTGDGPPKWAWHDVIYLKPADYSQDLKKHLEEWKKAREARFAALSPAEKAKVQARRRRRSTEKAVAVDDKLYQRLGWQGRCKPTLLPASDRHPHGRILLPLYCDTFSLGIMAISDDKGKTWSASRPIMGAGAIQPSVIPRKDGTLVAYLRDNGGSGHIKISESKDDGQTWGPVTLSELANPGAGIDGVRLADGNFCLVYNDIPRGRNTLAVSISDDEGKTWKWTRHLERHDKGSYHYPCVIQRRDGTIHSIYSYSVKGGESMKHAAFTEAWVKQGDK